MNRQMQIQQMMENPQFQQQFQQRLRGMNPSQILEQIANNPQAMNIPIVIEKLFKYRYSAVALVMVCENDKKSTCNE
jgi:hypothetical protein